MICADCAFAADLRVSTGNAQAAADAEARAWHEQCRTRNANREHGQLPDCMCQHGGTTGRPAEQYPGQYSTPKNGCPVCGGPVQVSMIDTGTKPYHDFIPGRWDCPRGCDPRTAEPEDVTHG